MKIKNTVGSAVLTIVLAAAYANNAQIKKENEKMIKRSTPILHVKSVEPCIKFWTERFGFKVTVQVPEGDHIGFAALEKGSIELMYQTYSAIRKDSANPLAEAVEKGPSFLFMEVPDIYAAIKSLAGAEIVQGLHDTFYGSKEVIAKDPGGHFVIFAQMPTK